MRAVLASGRRLDRRHFLRTGIVAIVAVASACGNEGRSAIDTAPPSPSTTAHDAGQAPTGTSAEAVATGQMPGATITAAPSDKARLHAWPGLPAQAAEIVTPGRHPLGLVAERDTLLYIPVGYQPDKPAPLVVMLHGAGGEAEHGVSLLQAQADETGTLLLAPASRGQTWDMIRAELGPDVTLIDKALAHIFSRYSIDAQRLAVGGFSDGASYALLLGVTNGDLFSHVIAFSPGYLDASSRQGAPLFYISHGTNDRVLPIERTSRVIVRELKQAGYEIEYREFEGPHTVPPAIATEAFHWLNQQ